MRSFLEKHVGVLRAKGFAVTLAAALPLMAAGAAEAGVAFTGGFEGGSQLINCALGECFRPPDTMGAVGTTQFLETANGYVRIYDKVTGAVQSSVNMATFWAAAGLPGGANGDQRVLFDHYSNRWIMTGFGTSGNIINIAVSANADASGPWQSTKIVGTNLAVPVAGTLDYPTLSLDNKGVYIGTNNFNPGFVGTSLFVIPKTSLFTAAPTLAGMTTFTTPCTGACATPDNGFAIQAALNWQGNPTNTASVMADSRDFNAQVFYTVTGVNAAGALQTASAPIVGSGYSVLNVGGRQPDGTRTVDVLAPRITANVVQLNGVLYSAITVANPNDPDHWGIRWSAVNALNGMLIEQGFIGGGGYDYYEGSIAVNEFGEAVIGYNRSGFQTTDANNDGLADGNISFLAQAFTVDAAGGLDAYGAELLLRVSGISNYHCTNNPPTTQCRERWGDYAAVTIDPMNHHNFYAIGEYASQYAFLPPPNQTLFRAIWNTYIAQVTFTPNAVPEPESFMLVLLGLMAASASMRRRRATRS